MDLYALLDQLNISFDRIQHEPVYTIDQAKLVSQDIDGLGCKCLFLKAKHAYYLLMAKEDAVLDLKSIGDRIGVKRLHLASAEDLSTILGCEPGAVSPLLLASCLPEASPADPSVTLLIDAGLAGNRLLVHGTDNCTTLSLAYEDLLRFVDHCGAPYLELAL